MLVIDIVELVVAKDFTKVNRLNTESALVADQRPHTLGCAMQFLKMEKYPGSGDQLWDASRGDDFGRYLRIEETIERINAIGLRHLRQIVRRLHPEHAQVPLAV